jgi:transcriptional regulator with XRE-family HTH domain
MDPSVWREQAGLTLREMAERLGRGWSSVRRWELGEKEAPNSVVLEYDRASKGRVTSADFARVRKRFLRRNEDSDKAA